MFGCMERAAFTESLVLGMSPLAACVMRGYLLIVLCVPGLMGAPLTKAATGLSLPGIKDYMVYEKIIITKKHEDLNLLSYSVLR